VAIPKFTSGLDVSTQRIQNLAAASSGTDAAQWQQVQDLIATTVEGKTWKDAVRATTTAALPALTYSSGAGTLTATANAALAAQDGVTLLVGERLLVKDQASGFQNGIYVVTQVGSGAAPFILTRAADASTATELRDGATVMVQEGTANAGKAFTQTATIADLTASAQTWTNTSATTYTAGNGLQLIGSAFSVLLPAGSGMTASGSGLTNDWTVTARKISADSVASATLTVTHSWGTRDVHVSVRDTTTQAVEYPDVVLNVNDVTITWPSAVGAGAKRATVIG
jgi:hypothetical protein